MKASLTEVGAAILTSSSLSVPLLTCKTFLVVVLVVPPVAFGLATAFGLETVVEAALAFGFAAAYDNESNKSRELVF